MYARVLVCSGLLVAICVISLSQDDVKLTESDKELLEKVSALVVKPTSECIRFNAKTYSCWGGGGEVERLGWLERDADKQPVRVLDIDGEWMAVPEQFETVDFLALCKKGYSEKEVEDNPFRDMEKTSMGPAGAWPELVVAYWCNELGDSALAATVLKHARQGQSKEETITSLKHDLAWRSFAGSSHAFINGDDAQALHYGERFAEKYTEFDAAFGTPASTILAELKRRKEAGTFGQYMPTEYDEEWNPIIKRPEGWDKWETSKKLDWLIEHLENVDERQSGQPGGVSLSYDWRVRELIALGEIAVPKLIDCIESDKRLTRSMHFWRDFARHRTVLAVREPALVAVMTILQVEVFDPVATGDNFTSRGQEGAKEVAAKLRKYWEEYGKYPFDERMMKILTNPEARLEARQEAALNLAYIDERPVRGTTVWTTGSRKRSEAPNPVVEKFKDPTTAEAIVKLMEEHVAQIAKDRADDTQMLHYYTRRAVHNYVDALVTLDDKRIVPGLKQRIAGDAEPYVKRSLSWACLWLDDDEPFIAMCKRFAEGTEPGIQNEESVADLIRMLSRVDKPEAEAALNAMLKPEHPVRAMYLDKVLTSSPGWSDDRVWFRTKVCIKLLRQQLDNTEPSGSYFEISGKRYNKRLKDRETSVPIPDWLTQDEKLAKHATGRFCDEAAMKLNELVAGLPRYNPLLSDAADRLATMRKLLDHYDASVRIATNFEAGAVGEWGWDPFYVLSPAPLDRAATAQDVKSAKALFHLTGAERANLKLPARGYFGELPAGTNDEPVSDDRERCLIFQAEIDADGKTWYGVVERYNMRKVAAEEVSDIRSLEE